MRPDRLQSAMSLFASRALGKVHSHNNQYFSVSLLAPLYIMLTCIYARLGWSLRIDVDFLKVFFVVGYAVYTCLARNFKFPVENSAGDVMTIDQ